MAIAKVLRWVLSLGAKFFRVVAVHTVTIVFLTLVSQVSTLLASILPLKVVILLGSDSIPRYFPQFFVGMGRDALIGSLSIATLGFFLVHLFSERLIERVTSIATSRLLAKSHKMILFENQDQVAASAYQRYSRALAGGVFITLALLGLGYFYFDVVLVLLSYVLIVFLMLWVAYEKSSVIRERLDSKLRNFLNVAGGIGFFVSFGYLVSDFIFWSPPGFIVAIVTLILSRQVMARIVGGVVDLAALRQQSVKLDALFFHGKALVSQSDRQDRTMWPLLHKQARNQWVSVVLGEFLGQNVEYVTCFWHQLGQANVAGLNVFCNGHIYLIKLFEVNRSSLALHEATLMGEGMKNIPSPRFVGVTKVQKFHCVVYAIPSGHKPEAREFKPLALSLRTQLLAVETPESTCHRYKRSRPMLWQRLDASLIERLGVAITCTDQQVVLNSFLNALPSLSKILQGLPLVLHQPDLARDMVWVSDDDTPLMLNWGRWSLEPVGAGWPEGEAGLSQLCLAIREASETRPALRLVEPKDAELAALAFALERECSRQRYVQALELMPLLLERLNSCKEK
ncbi:hypothetical protein [Chromohalobacter sp.]|uniref:hypothetical protein n=1 Tax=Chromohalobacter sp. TaxID=50740 RepID=UPI001D501E1C|nr:hypothetical protein [Chromohalobacter sp.]NQY44348.1 hypothetical protein [Chromohalobacter sp.]